MTFTTGSLDKPVLYDNINGIPLMTSSYDGRYYPDFLNYQNMTGTALNQTSWGGCYMCTSVNWCKYWVWRHTGKKLSMTRAEAMDVAADANGCGKDRTQDDIEGGYCKDCIGLLRFNKDEWQEKHKWSSGKSDLITEFEKICSKNGITESNLHSIDLTCTKENVIKTISTRGPFYWSHNPEAYCSVSGSHAILGCGFDKDYFYFKGSWSSDESDHGYSHLGKCSWDNFEKHGYGIYCYTDRIMLNL